ncbi:hypothetical protein BT69DRAFT_221266 [Atractiella rhizophila]|nr:hypothetical protein BT69DRAFT_221266 [Atractiella rhizophila]
MAASQRCLVLGEYTEHPRIRTVQTIILFCQNLQTTGLVTYADTFALSLLAVAIRISQVLTLHRLGEDEDKMPPDDPALPPGKNSLKRQMALRIFGIICFQDWMSATTVDRAYLINPSLVDSEPPMNINDDSLSLTSSSVTRQPPQVLTDVTYERMKLAVARMMQTTHEKILCAPNKGPGYDVILALDDQYQDMLSHLPDEFTRPQPSNQSPVFHWHKYGSQDMIHYRLMKLHRPFLFLKASRREHGYSKEQCIRSASIVVRSVFELRETLSHVW